MLKAARSAPDMLDELRAADEWLDAFFQDWDDDMSRYYGPGYRKDVDAEVYDPENFSLEWVSLMVPQCVFGNPRTRVKTSRQGEQRAMAKAHELALNRWIRDTKMRALNEKLAVDYGMRWAICLTLPGWEEGVSEHEDPRNWPTAKRISPRRFRWDPLAIEWEDARWYGHKSIMDKEDLLERAEANPDEGWNVHKIETLTEGSGLHDIRQQDGRDYTPDRGEVVIWNVWVPEYKPDKEDIRFHGQEAWSKKGVRGAWLTLGIGQDAEGDEKAEWLRNPYPYWGRRRGPYTMIGTYIVPDETGPLGPIPAVKGQTDELNDHARALSKAMVVHKKGILVDGTDPDWQDKIREFEDHWVVALEGLDEIDKKVKEVELGGATDLHVTHVAILRDRVQRNSGITEAQQGRPRADVTATAEQTAVEAGSIRTGFQVHKFRDGVADILEAISWYLYFDETEVELGPEAVGVFVDEITGEPIERLVYRGGVSDKREEDEETEGEQDEEGEEELWESYGLEIEPYSMEKTSEALVQRRMMDLTNALGFLVPMMAQYPFVVWDDLIELLGEAMNMPNLGDFFDMDALGEFREAVMGAAIEAQGKGAGPGQVRHERDLGPGIATPPTQMGGRPGANGSPVGALLGALSGANVGAGLQ